MRLAALLLPILAALALSACGGGGGSTQEPGAPTETATAPSGRGATPEAPGGGKANPQSHSGTRSHYEGGEKCIEEFGSEAEGPGRAALLGAFHGYLDALAARDYTAACPHLATTVQRALEQLVVQRLKAKGCEAILPKLLAPTAAAIAREQAAGRVTRVRVKGERAFVVFHAPGARLYQLTMAREGGRWKAATVAASVLVPSAATLGTG